MNCYNRDGSKFYCLNPINQNYTYWFNYNIGSMCCYDDNSINPLHRLDGQAVEYSEDGLKFWYCHGQRIDCTSQEEFEKVLKMKAFL